MSDRYPQPPARDPRRPFIASPFTRLARTHAFSVGGDALFTVGLAGSVFFAVPLGEARWKVGLYLLLTFAPFAVAAPLIGPAIDRLRGGRRWMIIGSLALRALLCVLIVRDITHVTFYLEAFLMLVFAKAYLISRAAVVPTTVRTDQELVEANSKLSLLSGVAAVVAGVPAAILLKLGGEAHGPQVVVAVAGVVFAIGAVVATQLPKSVVAEDPPDAAEKLELRSAGIRLAASAMELIRGAVGLLLLVIAFDFKNTNKPLAYLGAIGLMAQAGVLAGAALAPRLRRTFSETQIITGSLAFTMVGGFVAAFLGGLAGAAILSLILGATSGTAKQAFDALVQRDAPDANRGRSFARFETRFQLAWVFGAFLPVVIPFGPVVGFFIVGVLMAIGLVSYRIGQRRVARGTYDWESPSQRLLREARSRVGPGRGEPGADPGAAPAAGEVTTPTPRPPLGPPSPGPEPDPPGRGRRGRRGRRRLPSDEWEPPAGFVAHPLTDGEPGASTPPPPPSPPLAPPAPPTDPPAVPSAPLGPPGPPPAPPAPPTSPAPTPPMGTVPLVDQPVLPFDGGAVEPVVPVDEVDPDATTVTEPDPTQFAEPRWRDSR